LAAETVYIFDACAVIALLQQEPGAERVSALLEESGNRCLLHTLNLCEVYYDFLRRGDASLANALEGVLRSTGFELTDSLQPSSFWQTAGRIKAEMRRVSMVDCFAVALTIQERGILVTSDHHELDAVAAAKICSVEFIR
jgi:uncharacterized protein with PIN domain